MRRRIHCETGRFTVPMAPLPLSTCHTAIYSPSEGKDVNDIRSTRVQATPPCGRDEAYSTRSKQSGTKCKWAWSTPHPAKLPRRALPCSKANTVPAKSFKSFETSPTRAISSSVSLSSKSRKLTKGRRGTTKSQPGTSEPSDGITANDLVPFTSSSQGFRTSATSPESNQ